LAGAIVPLQGSDGLWRADLLNAARFPAGEASGSGFFTFALAWGIQHGILSRDVYLPVVRKGWSGLVTLQMLLIVAKVKWHVGLIGPPGKGAGFALGVAAGVCRAFGRCTSAGCLEPCGCPDFAELHPAASKTATARSATLLASNALKSLPANLPAARGQATTPIEAGAGHSSDCA